MWHHPSSHHRKSHKPRLISSRAYCTLRAQPGMYRLLDGFGSVTSLGYFACRATEKSAADADRSGNWSKLPVGLLRSSAGYHEKRKRRETWRQLTEVNWSCRAYTRFYECGLPRLHHAIKFSYFGLTRAVCQDHSTTWISTSLDPLAPTVPPFILRDSKCQSQSADRFA